MNTIGERNCIVIQAVRGQRQALPAEVATEVPRQKASAEVPALRKYVLKLYITGRTVRSQRAIDQVRMLFDGPLDGRCEVQIIDVLKHPELAEADKIMATPTLIRSEPAPVRRLLGDLTDMDKVLTALDLARVDAASTPSCEAAVAANAMETAMVGGVQ